MQFFSRHIFFSLLTLIFIHCGAQTYNFKNYSLEQGLPQSQVLSILQDYKGYMWFGLNSGGVTKFDGNRFTTLTTADGLADNVVFSIAENKNHHLFFGTSKGLSVYNGITIKNYSLKEGLKNSLVYKVLADEEKLWIGTQEGVYLLANNKILPFNSDPVLNQSSVYTMLIDAKKNIWFGTLQNGVICYDPAGKKFYHFTSAKGLNSDLVFSLSQNENGNILVGTQYGLNKINSKFEVSKASEIPSNDNISISCIIPNGNNKFYLGTQSAGIMDFNFTTKTRVASYNLNNGLTNNPIQCLYKDREGNLWIGTDGAGVYKYLNNRFVYYNKTNGFVENYINSVGVDSYNNIWAGLKRNGLVKISGNTLQKYIFDIKRPDALPDNDINAVLSLENGKMLFGTSDGLCLFENNTMHVIGGTTFRNKFILSLYRDRSDQIWIGTNESIYKLTDGIIAEETSINKFKIDGRQFPALFITEDAKKRKWFGTENGLLLIERSSTLLFNSSNGLIDGRINCGIIDHKDNLWVGTEDGLYRYNNRRFIKISAKGLTTGYINFLQTDRNNHLLIGTNNGIDILDLNDFYKNKITVKHFGKDDGLVSLESNSNAVTQDSSGRIIIGTVNGIEIYDPRFDKINKKEARINITNIKLFFGQEDILKYASGIDSLTTLPSNLVLPFSKNNLTFQFVGISLVAPEKVLYQYKLEGIDKDWTPAIGKTEATYPSLPPGKYTFMVRAGNNDGIWNTFPATYEFEILSPWYKTVWFYVLCGLILITGIISYNYLKTRKLKADKQKLEETVNERTKELRKEKEKVEIINKEVVLQKAEIEHKNIEITDSIKYAKNIQEALLPALGDTEKALDNCFIFYLPKDIVSGDFFWFHENEQTRYIAAADCTGHGVPGAFMSIIGNTLLNDIVSRQKNTRPGDILLELHKGVKKALHQSQKDSQRRDGMDIALCAIDKTSSTINYSGANRPLWIFRKNKDYQLEIIKPNKFPIGGLELEENRVYQNHSISVLPGDCIYIFSDGFADQFGGPRGKKFMLANMQKLLHSNMSLEMHKQKEKIALAFNEWKQDLEQIDDILVIGIRI
ncbi:MAG: two-component regulator propeller domain-containing protein [Bacteroidia bacterium]